MCIRDRPRAESEEAGMKSMREATLRIAAMVVILMALGGAMQGQSSADALEIGFKTPPNSAKPRVWWHWMNCLLYTSRCV